VIDLRKESSTFCNIFNISLNSNNNDMLFIPAGFAHGIFAVEDSTIIYTSSTPYDEKSNFGINFLDPNLNLDIPQFNSDLISIKDKNLPTLKDFLKNHYGKL
jgi:dTDP-4-dehydrorhamnose 3,5-epimerase